VLIPDLEAGTVPPDRTEELRRAIRNGDCIFCHRGGFLSILGHIVATHGLDGREFRDLLGFTYTESICSEDWHRRNSESRRGQFAFGKYHGKTKPGPQPRSLKGQQSLRAPHPWAAENAAQQSRAKRIPDGHGHPVHYKRGCRCELCKAAMAAYAAAYRERQGAAGRAAAAAYQRERGKSESVRQARRAARARHARKKAASVAPETDKPKT
jgi:hypothetical protein